MPRGDLYHHALLRLLEVPSSPRLGLERMESLLAALGDPHRGLRVLHVAGTNGKGSIAAFLDAVLAEAGLRRGLTTSPHLLQATERIRLDGEPVAEARFVELEAAVHEAAARLDDAPTFFERIIAMALLAFAEAQVDVAIVEVGLGGRLDATNVVQPAAVGLGPVGLDHTQWLGDTLAAIAGEKVGVLKPGVPVTSAPQAPAAAEVIGARAAEVGAPLAVVGEQILLGDTEAGFEVKQGGALLADPFRPGLVGHHQAENAAVALGVLEGAGLVADRAERARGLTQAFWPGRFELIEREGATFVLDGAHNGEAAAALGRALVTHPATRRRPVIGLFGATRGHDLASFAVGLGRPPESTIATQARAPRSVRAEEVQAALVRTGFPRVTTRALRPALEEAAARARKAGGVVLVTGSLYLVGEVRGALLGLAADPELPRF